MQLDPKALNAAANMFTEEQYSEQHLDAAEKIIRVYLSAAPSPSPAPGVVEALEFYADISKYPAPFTGGMGALWSDCGQIARAALASLSQPAKGEQP